MARRSRRRERARALDLAVQSAETARLQVESLRTELQSLHHEFARRDVEMLSALSRLTHATSALQRATERDLEDRTRLARAVELLAMFVAAPPVAAATAPPPAPAPPTGDAGPTVTVIGGSVDPSRPNPPPVRPPNRPQPDGWPDGTLPPAAHAGTIDLTDLAPDLPLAPATRAEAPLECSVHLKFGDRWIEGFQIEETLNGPFGVQFRLRRRVDGWILPELFDESEVRVFTQPVVDPVTRG